jgi:hypothetical protein
MPGSFLTQTARSVGVPIVATGCLSILGLFVVAETLVPVSSSANSDFRRDEFTVPLQADIPIPPRVSPSCDRQTWPYVEPRCRGDAGGIHKRVARVISPERAPTPEPAEQTQADRAVPAAETASEDQPVARVFNVLWSQPTTGLGDRLMTYQVKIAALDAVASPSPRLSRVTRSPRLVPRVAKRRPAVLRVGTVAKAELADPSVGPTPPDIAHGLY